MTLPTVELTYIAQYGYVALFGMIAASEVASFIPVGVVLIAVGALAREHYMSLTLSLLVAATASTLSDTIVFSIAHRLGRKEGYRRYVDNHAYALRIESFAEKHPRAAVFLSRLVGLASTPVNAIAGLSQMSRAVFIPFDFLGNALCAALYLAAGYYLGAAWESHARLASIVIGVIIALIIIGYLVFFFFFRKKRSIS
ncbi:MAG: alkaline phosphatase, DedA family [Parcubacteria group bacterium]|nr:alkaline phosphatase, DedA family [Parcubacteria group bacterium]